MTTKERKQYIGYSFGTNGESCLYNFVATYFIIYLSDVVGMSPMKASFIAASTILFEVISGVYIGWLSDNIKKHGRRRIFILIAAIFAPFVIFFMFGINGIVKVDSFWYYLLCGILFRITYSVFYIPHTALGAEMVTDYNGRIKLRSLARFFGIVGNFIGYTLPLLVFSFTKNISIDISNQWLWISIIIAVVTFISYFLCYIMTDGSEIEVVVTENKQSLLANLAEFKDLFNLKPMKMALLYKAFFIIGITLYSSSLMFYLKYRLDLRNDYAILIFAFTTVLALFITPVVAKRALKKGKKIQQAESLILGSVILFIAELFGGSSVIAFVFIITAITIAQSSFWQISNSIFYDIVEYDELENNIRREGAISCLQSVAGAVLGMISMQLMGIILTVFKFDASLPKQTAMGNLGLDIVFAIIPCIAFFIAGVIMIKYPIDKNSHIETLRKLQDRRNKKVEKVRTF